MKTFHRALSAVGLLLCITMATGSVRAATSGGTIISNTASATYTDSNGGSFATVSNTLATTVASVTGVTVGTKENGCNPATDVFVAGTNITRTYTVNNSSNIDDAYALTASTTGGTIVSIATVINGNTTTTPGSTVTTPVILQGGTVQVVVTIATTNVTVGTNLAITLTAKSTSAVGSNGQASDSATQCAIAAAKATIGGAGGPASQVVKLVDGKSFETIVPGQTLNYAIQFEDYGGTATLNTVLTDVFPVGLTPNLASVQVNGVAAAGAAIVGQTLTIPLGSLTPQTLYTLTVSATVGLSVPLGSDLINTVSLASSNAGTVVSSPASVLAGTANVVYDGYAGASQPIAGANVVLTSNGAPIKPSGAPIAPNTANVDPYVTGPGGTYAFGLGPTQIGPITYQIVITAPGYINRTLQVVLTPDATGTLYSVTVTALDGLPLALPGGFGLTAGPVTLPSVSGLFGNIPMFHTQSIVITKSVDRTVASGGDRLVYTLNFSNVATALGATSIVDTLPPGVGYAPGTGLVDGVHVEPTVVGRTLTWTLPVLTASHAIKYAVVISPGVSSGSTLTNSATVSAVPPNAPNVKLSATATVDTQVIGGIFSDCIIITGRVFVDLAKDGWFHKGDSGLANVRIFMEDGESVVTDSNGRYSFPCVRPEMHVLKLDKSTLPTGTRPFDVHDYDSQQSIRRLVHGVFDGGIIQDVNFAIEAVQ